MRAIGGALDPAQVPKISYPRTVPRWIPGNLRDGRVILTMNPADLDRNIDITFAMLLTGRIFSVLIEGPGTALRQNVGRLQTPTPEDQSAILPTPLAASDRFGNFSSPLLSPTLDGV
jgi:hypothetical protein